jgi:threonine synthase
LQTLVASGWIGRDERVVVFNTGAAQKYVEALRTTLPRIDHRQSLDWGSIESAMVP